MTPHQPRPLPSDLPAVEELRTSVYTVPTDAPEGDGTLAWQATTLVLVEARSGDVHGLGWSYTGAAARAVVDDLLAPVVLGGSALDVPARNEAMRRAVRNAGAPGLVSCAVSAVDLALWDLKAKLLGLPLVHLLGACRDDVPVYGSGGFTPYSDEQTRRQLTDWVQEQGIPRVKIKVGEEWGRAEARDLHRVRLARETVGPDTELYVDANGGYGRKQAVRMGRAFDAEGVRWFEEPVSSDDLPGLREVRDRVTADVAAGEYGWDLPTLARLAASGAVDCLQADVTRCGGLTVWLRAAAVAEAHGLQISAHCAPALHAHAAAAVPNFRHLEWFHDHTRLESLLFADPLPLTDGSLHPTAATAPGHGRTLRTPDAAPYRTA